MYIRINVPTMEGGKKKQANMGGKHTHARARAHTHTHNPFFKCAVQILNTNFKPQAYRYTYSSYMQWTTHPKMQFQEVIVSCKVSVEQYASISHRTPFKLSVNTIQVITGNFHQFYNKFCNYKTDFLIY
jgi:hypothetical protein